MEVKPTTPLMSLTLAPVIALPFRATRLSNLTHWGTWGRGIQRDVHD
jgi:hypothetical protein